MDPDPNKITDHDQTLSERFSSFGERLGDAAVEAEYDTGVHEETEEKAKSHIAVRLARMTAGILTVIVGIALLPLPGPGWVVIAGGLAILAQDFAWAEKTLRYVRRKAPGIPEDGKIPRSTWILMGIIMTLAVGGSFILRRYVDLSDAWQNVQDLF